MREIDGPCLDREEFELWNEPVFVGEFYDTAVVK
jgi:hypothetical protein